MVKLVEISGDVPLATGFDNHRWLLLSGTREDGLAMAAIVGNTRARTIVPTHDARSTSWAAVHSGATVLHEGGVGYILKGSRQPTIVGAIRAA